MSNGDEIKTDLETIVSADNMTKWETDFCNSLLEQIELGRTLSVNQLDKAQELIQKWL